MSNSQMIETKTNEKTEEKVNATMIFFWKKREELYIIP